MQVFSMIAAVVLAFLAAGLWLQLRRSQRRFGHERLYRAHFEQSSQAKMLIDGETLQVLHANAAFLRKSGYALEDLAGTSALRLFGDEKAAEAVASQLREPVEHVARKVRLKRRDGQTIEVDLMGHRVHWGERLVLGYACHDISMRAVFESKLLEKQQHLDHVAHHDQLTGLPNRLFLTAHLPVALKVAEQNNQLLAVLFLDLDRFKHINDSRGHETGDQLLKAVAQRFRDTLRGEDVVARMGGDEFVVVLKSVRNPKDVHEATQRLIESLASPIVIGGTPLITTASIGVSLFPRDGSDMTSLLQHSDTAMYKAKERGRNNCQIFSPFMNSRLKRRIAMETHLRLALEGSQLDVHYQPIVAIGTQKVMALEALVRWNHPTHGYISPARFIGVAEDSGLIVPIGEFVLARVLQDAVRWRKAGLALVPIALNVSAAQLQRSNLAGLIVHMTQELGLEPTILQVELTEGTIFERREGRNGESNEDAVTKLRELGIHISIDDFGTGYSSLSYLKRWPVDSIKIDKSFVRDLGSDPSDLAIVGAIIAMARHLDIRVIAEGIESWQQLEMLRELGCDAAQGHLIGHPTPPRSCARFLKGLPIDLTESRLVSEPPEPATDTTAAWSVRARQA
ncbi:MAG TPA: EAL domain-containing protein [Steroidobacteraceae bacterium]|nr:EAL domain-containing protein [Steroidobacteraceae bacterium]